MKVVILHPDLSMGREHQPQGAEVDVEDSVAESWIARGLAKKSDTVLEVSTPKPKPKTRKPAVKKEDEKPTS